MTECGRVAIYRIPIMPETDKYDGVIVHGRNAIHRIQEPCKNPINGYKKITQLSDYTIQEMNSPHPLNTTPAVVADSASLTIHRNGAINNMTKTIHLIGRNNKLTIAALEKHLGYKPATPVETGIERFLD